MLQRHSGFALLVDLVDPLQALTEASGQYREQRVVFSGERPMFGQLDPEDQHSAEMAQRDARRARFLGATVVSGSPSRNDSITCRSRGVRSAHPTGSPAHISSGATDSSVAGESHGQNAPRLPHPAQLLSRSPQGVVDRICLGQLLIERGQRGLALHEVMLGRDVPHRADHDLLARVGIFGVVEGGRNPDPVPVPVIDRDGEAAVSAAQHLARTPPRPGDELRGRSRRRATTGEWPDTAAFWAVAENLGERVVDLYDGAVLVADEERLLQRVDQRSAPAGLMVAQPRQLDVGADSGQQLRRGEWFDEVVVGAGLQAFDRGFLPGARGQQQNWYGCGSRLRPQRRDQLQSVHAWHHDVADDKVGNLGADGLQRLLAVVDSLT